VQKVLIVEDDADLRRMYRAALTFNGYEVVEAGDGLRALQALEGGDIDLIVLDLGLPVISGQAVLQDVAGHAHTRSVPVVIVVTGTPGPHRLADAACVLTKPVLPNRLVGAVRRCLAAGSSTSGA